MIGYLLGEGFRIKTQKLRGQISQGLALSLKTLNLDENLEIGTDLTDIFQFVLFMFGKRIVALLYPCYLCNLCSKISR